MTSSRKIVRTGTRMVGNLLLCTVLLGSLAFVVPSLMGYDRYVIMGGSMTGTYDLGAVVFEKQVATDALEAGDVITYVPPADSGIPNLVTHRIVKVTADPTTGERVFRTKGDNNPRRDPWTFGLSNDVQPRVEFAVPYVGYAFMALADREKRMMIVGIPAAVVALFSIAELVGSVRPNAKKPAGTDQRTGEKSGHETGNPATATHPSRIATSRQPIGV